MKDTMAENQNSVVPSKERFHDRGTIDVTIFENFEDLASMQREWDDFMESIDAEIFLTYDWGRIWWKYYGRKRELAIFVFRSGGSICAILPLFLEKIWIGPVSVSAIKVVGTDYMPVTTTVPIKRNFIDHVIELLMKELVSKWHWDIVYLGAICGRYALMAELARAFERVLGDSYHYEVKSKDVQTYFQVADNWEQQVAALAQKQRTNVKRTYREISRKRITVCSILASTESFSQMFTEFVRMHQAHWQKLGKPGHFGAWPSSADFHREVASIQLELKRLRLVEIRFNDQIVGYEYIYRLDGTYFWFLNARAESQYSARIDYKWIAFREKIENALSDGVRCIDGMRGRYDYKLLMGGSSFPINNIFVYSKKLSRLSRVATFRFLAWCLDVGYSRVWRARIAPRLGIRPKAFWEKWIRFHPLSY